MQYLNASASDDDGVIGYHAHTVAPPYTQPRGGGVPVHEDLLADAVGLLDLQSDRLSLASAYSRPSFSALTFESSSFSLPLLPAEQLDHGGVHAEQHREHATYMMFLNSCLGSL